MTKDEYKLLENLISGLDRLFDFQSNAVELHALIFATSRALANTEYFAMLDNASIELEKLVTSQIQVSDERYEALRITDDLRISVAEALAPFHSQEISNIP